MRVGSAGEYERFEDVQKLCVASANKFHSCLCPSPTVPNLLLNEDECKKFEIRAHSTLSEGQMHKIFFFQLGMVKSTKIV